MEPRYAILVPGKSPLDNSEGLLLIPSTKRTEQIGVPSLFFTPLYWNLPSQFLGDKIQSYNGYLRFSTISNGYMPFPPGILEDHPMVFLRGNNLSFVHYPEIVKDSGHYQVR